MLSRVVDPNIIEKGPGRRGSDAGTKVAVFGATGFLGRYLCCHLGKNNYIFLFKNLMLNISIITIHIFNSGTNGHMTYIGSRGDDMDFRFLRPMFELGRSKFQFYSPRNRESMAKVISDVDVVVNLIGNFNETTVLSHSTTFPYLEYKTNYTFEETNIDIPREIAELCAEMQVDNFIHVSSINARSDSKSEWVRSKYEGEKAVKEAFPWATIIRPSQMFGPEDTFLSWFANVAKLYPCVPLFNGGQRLTQPVYVVDVADTIMKVVEDPEVFEGRTIDCFGSSDYTYKELASFVYDITMQYPVLVDFPRDIALLSAEILQYIPGTSLITPDRVFLWSEDFVPPMSDLEYKKQTRKNKIFTMKDLGINSTPIERIAFNCLHRYRNGSHFSYARGYH